VRRLVQWWAFVAGVFLAAGAAVAQVTALEFRSERAVRQRVFNYLKSNVDGSHAGEISVFVADGTRIESLKKWGTADRRATLVIAEMDWPRFSVRRFEAWELTCNEPPLAKATLQASDDGTELAISILDRPVRVSHWPWHSYDFDFASLSLILPHLRDPRAQFAFWRTDFIFSDPPSFGELGEIRMAFQRSELRNGKTTRRYSIAGPGLRGTRGTWWSDAETGVLVEFEIPIPDEPGYKDVRMRLLSTEPMTTDEWAAAKHAAVCGD
jgi:hypothetical protein